MTVYIRHPDPGVQAWIDDLRIMDDAELDSVCFAMSGQYDNAVLDEMVRRDLAEAGLL